MSQRETVRRGTSADIPTVMEIGKQSTTAPRWQLTDYDMIFRTERTLLVAESEGRIVGFVIGHNLAGEWELENLVVGSEFRRRGIGERLVWELILEAKRSKAEFIFLEARESNSSARKLYERCGFQQNGRRKDYYSNPPEDAVLYRFLCNPKSLENC